MVNKEIIPKQAYNEANKFCTDFYDKYGIFPFISFKPIKGEREALTLASVEFIINALLQKYTKNLHLNLSVKLKRRPTLLITYRQCMFKILHDMGYSLTTIGKYFDFNHATVLHGKNEIIKYLELNDNMVLKIYNEINDELENQKARNADSIYHNDGTESNT